MTRPSLASESSSISLTFLKFGVVGGLGVAVNLGVLWCAQVFGLTANLASALAIEISIISNFILNDRWTFRAATAGHAWPSRALRFQLVSSAGALIQWGIFIAFNLWWAYLELSASADATSWGRYQHTLNQGAWYQVITRPPEVGAWVYLSQVIGIGGATAWNFFANYYWTWSKRERAQL